MCNLDRLSAPLDEVAVLFEAINELSGANLSEEVYSGYPGAEVTEGHLHRMTWGFPLQMKGKQGQALKPKPVNNPRTDKLGSYFRRAAQTKRLMLYRAQKSEPLPSPCWLTRSGKSAVTPTYMVPR
jgi:hypothetical protein